MAENIVVYASIGDPDDEGNYMPEATRKEVLTVVTRPLAASDADVILEQVREHLLEMIRRQKP